MRDSSIKKNRVAEYSPAKTGAIREYSPIFETVRVAKKYLKDNKHNGALPFGHNLFLVAHSFLRASLSENSSLLGTDNVRAAYFRAK